MRRLTLRNLVVGLRLDCVNEIGELDSVLDEEHRDVVANDIPVALLSVELDRKPTDIANSVSTASRTLDGREPNKDRCLPRRVGKNAGARKLFYAFKQSEGAKGTCSSRMDYTLRDTFMVKTMDLYEMRFSRVQEYLTK